jgi:hypothetical protein
MATNGVEGLTGLRFSQGSVGKARETSFIFNGHLSYILLLVQHFHLHFYLVQLPWCHLTNQTTVVIDINSVNF